ncbi:N-acetyltransferase 9 [Linnemannia exigua]|uniref:N-acetyltransferase 9 n=1 Tax=Linnemannia exigua TaxID=604196 RepID=A0AAD4H5P6_9FUNG|nr:N-acetyltransferase 9 [Linnemannia exigua]
MLENENLVLVGQTCVLVPYLKRHVEHYNKWMQSPELLGKSQLRLFSISTMTASEPLTIEEEYEMQESWRVDENKCTFIILARESPDQEITPENALAQPMVGDVNLFFNDHDDPHAAEIEIMIAGKSTQSYLHFVIIVKLLNLFYRQMQSGIQPSYRRKGMGLEALRMMMTYAYQSLGTKRITAKISTENKGSIQLFLTQLGFVQISYSQIFEEVTLERGLTAASKSEDTKDASTETADHGQESSSSSSVAVAEGGGISVIISAKKDGEDEDEDEDCIQEPATTAFFETLELNVSDLDHPRDS